MKTPALAVPELERRVSNWLSVSNGAFGVVTQRSGAFAVIHSLPTTTPWIVTCSNVGLEVKLWWEELETHLTTVALTEEECRPLVSAVGQKMRAARCQGKQRSAEARCR
jgi:hypothetical protein